MKIMDFLNIESERNKITMMKDLFLCDYSEGCHPNILKALEETNFEQTPGYSTDYHSAHAREMIKEACQAPDAEVHFLVGGTQTNTTVIAALLRPHQGVLCATNGHVNVHETGAIESTGHKVLPLEASNGKISADQIRDYCKAHFADENFEHVVQPGMVYISHPTEYGTLYTASELEAISIVCHEYNLPLFVDGARLGYGLAAEGTDVTLPLLAKYADVFYIGGTKVGALFGEAVVFTNKAIAKDFRYIIKQRGGMLAKGRLLGIQFEELMKDDLYTKLGAHANKLAYRVRDIFEAAGYDMLFDSPTNQQFPILPDEDYEVIRKTSEGEFWERVDDTHSAVRFCTSWCTSDEAVDRLETAVKALHN